MWARCSPTDSSSAPTRSFNAAPPAWRWAMSGSPTISSTGMRGLRELYGSWKIICMWRRAVFLPLASRVVMSTT